MQSDRNIVLIGMPFVGKSCRRAAFKGDVQKFHRQRHGVQAREA